MRVLGLDPSLTNFGIVLAELDVEKCTFEILDMCLVDTAMKSRKDVRKNSQDLMRASMIRQNIVRYEEKAVMAFVEVPHGSQSARAMASYGVCIGLIASLSIPVIQLTAAEVKAGAVGDKNASKEEMIEWATREHPEAKWLMRGVSLIGKNEHLADATAAIHAGLSTDQFNQAKVFMKAAGAYA